MPWVMTTDFSSEPYELANMLRGSPAAKAPAVSLKPRRWVSREAPVTVSKHKATNVSSLRDSATTCIHWHYQ